MSQEVVEVREISDSEGSKMADLFTRVANPARPVDVIRKEDAVLAEEKEWASGQDALTLGR